MRRSARVAFMLGFCLCARACTPFGADRDAGWVWEGDTNEQWKMSNGTDCCGCSSTTCLPCTDNTSIGSAGAGITYFTSGPAIDSGNNHRADGFVAIRADYVRIAPK